MDGRQVVLNLLTKLTQRYIIDQTFSRSYAADFTWFRPCHVLMRKWLDCLLR
jgi:hypothetical protein